MTKNKVMNIKIIFKIYLKILKTILDSQTDFCSTKYHRTIFKNCC